MKRLEYFLDDIHSAITNRWFFQIFTAFTRVLLAVGFIPPSYTKIMHHPFTMMPDSNPVGHYFRALYETGFYYEFIGWGQMIAAILLLFPRTAHLGALLFFPIIINIAVLTSSVGFAGTWLLTIFMALAATWLVAWDYDRLKPILFYKRTQPSISIRLQTIVVPIVFALGGAMAGGAASLIRLGNASNYGRVTLGLVGLGLVFGTVVVAHLKFMKVGDLATTTE